MSGQFFDYELLHAGGGWRRERFGGRIIDRPCPQADWPESEVEPNRLYFDRDSKPSVWQGVEGMSDTWNINLDHLKLELRFAAQGQVGIFPEQLENWRWIKTLVDQSDRPLKILNAFAYTGVASLFASNPQTEVCHLDGSKGAVTWAKRNAELSGLAENKIRWMVDDVNKFIDREIKRGNQYDGIILDPPAFGRGRKGEWKIEQDLPRLIGKLPDLLTAKPKFVILTCHAPEHFTKQDLAELLHSIPQFSGQKAQLLELNIEATQGPDLPSSFGARISL